MLTCIHLLQKYMTWSPKPHKNTHPYQASMDKMYKHTTYGTETSVASLATHVYAQAQAYICFSADFFIPPHMKGCTHALLIKPRKSNQHANKHAAKLNEK